MSRRRRLTKKQSGKLESVLQTWQRFLDRYERPPARVPKEDLELLLAGLGPLQEAEERLALLAPLDEKERALGKGFYAAELARLWTKLEDGSLVDGLRTLPLGRILGHDLRSKLQEADNALYQGAFDPNVVKQRHGLSTHRLAVGRVREWLRDGADLEMDTQVEKGVTKKKRKRSSKKQGRRSGTTSKRGCQEADASGLKDEATAWLSEEADWRDFPPFISQEEKDREAEWLFMHPGSVLSSLPRPLPASLRARTERLARMAEERGLDATPLLKFVGPSRDAGTGDEARVLVQRLALTRAGAVGGEAEATGAPKRKTAKRRPAKNSDTRVKKQELQADAWLTCPDLAKAYGVDQEPLRKRLERFRSKNFNGWKETADRKPREPRYMYHVGTVRRICEEVKVSVGASAERPSKKKSRRERHRRKHS